MEIINFDEYVNEILVLSLPRTRVISSVYGNVTQNFSGGMCFFLFEKLLRIYEKLMI